MTTRQWQNITNYMDTVGTTLKTFSFNKTQNLVKVTIRGNANVTYSIGSQSGTLTPGQNISVAEKISSFTLTAVSGTQTIEVWSTEDGTQKIEDDSTDPLAQLSDYMKYDDCFRAGNRFYRSMYAYANKLTENNIISNTTIDKTPFEVNIIGDSIPGFMADPMLQYLVANKKINGLGYSNFAYYGQTFGNPFEKCVRTGFPITQDDATNAENWGICGRCSKGSGTDTISYQTLEPFTHTDLALFYCKKSGGGVFSYSIDGGTPVQVNTNDVATSLGIIELNGLTEICHKVDIAIVSGSVTLYGIRTWKKNKNGVLLNMMNEGGTKCSQWAAQMGMMNSYLNAYPTHQLHVWIGANDVGLSTADQFQTNLESLLNTYPIGNMTDIVLYTHYERGTDSDISLPDTSFNTNIALYDNNIRTMVLEHDASLFDVSKIFPHRTIGYNAGMFADVIHPSAKGASFVAMVIVDRCLPHIPSDAFINKRTFENTNKIPLFMAGKRNKIEYITSPAVSGIVRRCGVLAQNGKIYAMGRGSNEILCIDPKTNLAEVAYFDSTWGGGSLFDGMVSAPNGLLYLIPSRTTTVKTFDPIYNTVNDAITGVSIISSTDNWTGGVLTPEGKIYCAPAGTSQKNIMVIDTNTNTVSYIDTTSLSLTTGFKGGVYAPNGKIYYANFTGTDILVVDTSNNSIYKLTSASGSSAFWGGVVGPKGKLYFIPAYAGQIQVIDPSTDAITYITGTDTANRPSYQGGVLAPDGKIYCPPYNSTKMLVIDPVAGTKDETTYTGFTANGSSYSGAVVAPNGKIYCLPENTNQIMVINPDYPSLQLNPLLSPLYNKSW